MKGLKYILLYLLLVVPATCMAQVDMIVDHYGLEQGLPNNTVYCSVKDRDGFVWFGTWHGLCSFDGVKFTQYVTRRNRHSAVPPRKVLSVVEDGRGYLWVRNVDNRLWVFDKTREIYHEVYDELKCLSRNVQVIKIQRMDNGNILLLTRNKNLYEASVEAEDRISIKLIYDARADINPADMKLHHNVLGETADYVFWIGMDYKIAAVKKTCRQTLLHGMQHDKRMTYFWHNGNTILVGTTNGLVYNLDVKRMLQKQYMFPSIHEPITCLASAGGLIYMSTSSSFYSMTVRGVICKHNGVVANATNTYVDKYNKLWLLSGHVLAYFDPQTRQTKKYPFRASSEIEELSFHDAGQNGLFIILRDGDTWHYDRRTCMMNDVCEYKQIAEGRAGQQFFDIDIDKDGLLWLSSTTNGIYKICFPRHGFSFIRPDLFTPPVGTPADNLGVRSIYQSRNGDIWVGTRAGVVYCLDSSYKVKRSYTGTIGNVYNIMEDRRGRLWFSTKGAGLVMAEADAAAPQGLKLTRYTVNASDNYAINSNKVYYAYQDSHNRIWVCTFGGGLNLIEERRGRMVFHNKDNDFIRYPKYDLYTNVRSVVEDDKGRLWVGTIDGLISFRSSFTNVRDISFETYREKDNSGIADNDIYSMFKDHSGHIWIGVFGRGLNKLTGYDVKERKPVFKTYGFTDRAGGNVVSSIIEDHQQYLWMCTENGLVSMRRGRDVIRDYDKFSGFPNVDIEDNTTACLRNGQIIFGCRQGVMSFFPATVRGQNRMDYRTFIVDFDVLNRNLEDFDPPVYEGSVRYAKEIKLNHDQSMFTIEYAALNYADQSHLSYKYILEGYETQWHFNGNNRIASYANVPPGHYVFRVKVVDDSTGKETPECSLKITVRPPWWASWWAYCIYAILILAILYGVARVVLYMIKMRNEVYINDRLAELKIRFFTNVSHELRTPLTLIKSPIEELKKNEKLSTTGMEYLALIDKSAQQMLQLVNQILDFRKIQNGKMQLHLSLVDINDVFGMFRQEFSMHADEHDVAFRIEMPEEHVMVWCDAEKISIVIRNLLSNAFKFTRKGGTICMALERSTDENKCVIKVEDDGVGIPKSQLGIIFERFSQADNKSDDTLYTGTGIGLSLSKEYINMHHGRIWAENGDDGKGATFIVEIPMGRELFNENEIVTYVDDNTASIRQLPQSMGQQETAGTPDENRPVLILIEDNTDLCRMLQLQLQSMYNIYVSNDGENGLKKIYQYHPDIIVTDLMMPGLDGMELLRRVRKDFSISHIPVIVLTAKSGDDDMMDAITSGANAYITKPFNSGYLVARINQLLEEQRVFHRKIFLQGGVAGSDNSNKDTYEKHLVQKDLEFVHKIHEVIEDNINTENFNIDTIAESIGLSRSAFFKKLKSLTGFAPVDLVKEVRLAKAAILIETTDESITEIAYSVGFRDSGYFGKCFRKKYNMTPKEYRNDKHGK